MARGSDEAVLIREVTEGDFEQWRVLWEGYNAFYGRAGATALPDAVTRVTWARFFDAGQPLFALVAARGARLVGLAHLVLHGSTIAIAPVCYLQDLYVAGDCRGAGIGRALIEAVYEYARSHGSRRVYWQTHETNAAARRLYDTLAQRSGFIVYRHDLQS